MAVSFTTSGYIEVWKGAEQVSRHRSENEAVESVLNHGPGSYEIRRPITKVVVTNPLTGSFTIDGEISGDT